MMKKLAIIMFVFSLCTAAFAQNASKTLVAYFSFPITGGKEAFLKMQQLNKVSTLETVALVRVSAHINKRCLPNGKLDG